MAKTTGYRSPEFGVYPVELRFSLDSHVGPAWVVPALFNKSGWLAVAEVEMETDFDRKRAVIAACVNEEGEVLGEWVAEALFSMQCSLPQEAVIEPPDDLEDALYALYWDFLGRCDQLHLHALGETERRIDTEMRNLEARRSEVYERVERFLSNLYARRRRERGDRYVQAQLAATIEEVEKQQAETERWHWQKVKELRSEIEDFERQVMGALKNHGSFRPLYTVYWQAQHSKRRTLANSEFVLRFGSRKQPIDQTDIGAIELDAKLHGMESRERKRREFLDYYEALEKVVRDQQELALKLKIRSKQKNESAETVVSVCLSGDERSSTFSQLAAKSRDWEARHQAKHQQCAARIDLNGRLSEGSIRGDHSSSMPVHGVRVETSSGEIASAANSHLDTPREVTPPAFDEEMLLKDFERAFEEELSRLSPPELPETIESAKSHEEAKVTSFLLKASDQLHRESERRDIALPGKAGPDLNEGAPVIERSEPLPSNTEDMCNSPSVKEGDSVLLRFIDGGNGRFIRYVIHGALNDPSKGIIAITDPRAVSMLMKRTGDTVELEFPSGSRVAVIEKIMNPRDDATLTQDSKVKVTREAGYRVRGLVAERGDLVTLSYFEGSRKHIYRCILPLGSYGPEDRRLSQTERRALLIIGKQIGDDVTVRLGAAERRVTIDKIAKP